MMANHLIRRGLLAAAVAPLLLLLAMWCAAPAQAATVVVASIQGAISPASAAYFERALARARDHSADLLVVELDTPGGLDTAMRRMIQAMLASPVPIAVYVSPSGARAASAGTYLLYASHVAAMAPGTNVGAATPVPIGIGGEPSGEPRSGDKRSDDKPSGENRPDVKGEKAAQDAAAYLRSLAQLRGRNADWAEQAVVASKSISADEARKLGVIDLVATDLPDLLRAIEGRRVVVAGNQARTLALRDAALVRVEPNWHERLLARLADPTIALMLLMIGIYGLLFEFYSPGAGVPGVLGGICLLLALYGLALLPINAVGIALVLLGIALMVSEAFMPSFGVLGIGGLAAFVAGALMLVDADAPGVSLSWGLLLPFALAAGAGFAAVGWLALSARRRPPVSGTQAMLGASAEALEDIPPNGTGWVSAWGERWSAHCAQGLEKGAAGRIVAVNGLRLEVEADGAASKGEGP